MADGTARAAVALLDAGHLADDLAGRTGLEVVATTPDDHLAAVQELAGRSALVVGVAGTPWPQHADLHDTASQVSPAYRGVVAWHGLPVLLDALAQAAAQGVARGAHILVTAPDPGADAGPEDVVFLREVAELIAARVELTSRSIAWRGTTRTPTATTALTSVVEAHARRDVVEVPVAPGTPADPALLRTAEELGARLTTADLGRGALLDALAAVVATVRDHEREAEA